MNDLLRVGIIGDFDPHRRYHSATNEALRHAAYTLSQGGYCLAANRVTG
jgi:hypothetical protein